MQFVLKMRVDLSIMMGKLKAPRVLLRKKGSSPSAGQMKSPKPVLHDLCTFGGQPVNDL